MNQSLSAYPEYKPAGLPWLAKVPAHWAIKRAKQVFRTIDQRSETGAEEKLTVSSKNGVVPRREQKVTMFMAASYVGHKLCWPGDLVVNSLWAWANGLGFAKHHGIISTAYSVYRPLPEYGEAGPYLDYLLRSSAFQWEFQIGSKGIWISRLQLTDDTFMRMPILLPPLPEQQRIVAFLDGKTRQIARLLRNKRQLIKLLTEQRQAIIQRAVTQGVDADAQHRDSGVAWLGEVPAHWEVKSLKQITELIQTGPFGSQLHAEDYIEGGIPVINPSHLINGKIVPDYNVAVSEQFRIQLERHTLHKGDIVFARRGEMGRCSLVTDDSEGWLCGTGCLKVILSKKMVVPLYISIVLSSQGIKDLLVLESVGSTMDNLNTSILGRLQLPVPPIEEQENILEYINLKTRLIDQTIARAQREIELIQEYRTSLIVDVVTGRVDVRHLAEATSGAELPAEDELDLEDEESEEELLIETEDGRD
ncbi:restriction endonuclease subunit S [Hymenobacter guriensis]|uniref:Restriction endonuclease subunit S n=1 Tax=Hymenobacter guriensis TaxID=2793065 RepID=A0ABS0L4B9_9BACT|nr:restriction endonuclease subunit S [Hymenobacter guriensis]MBG8554993.1 restriction endonuclease subunit S [Hymenobacter guriensis]